MNTVDSTGVRIFAENAAGHIVFGTFSDATLQTTANKFAAGAIMISTGKMYANTGTFASPTWTSVYNTVNGTFAGVVTAQSGIAATAGGAEAIAIGAAGPNIYWGSGVPTISAAKGSLYLRTDGSSGSTRAYINTDGATTWTNITTAA